MSVLDAIFFSPIHKSILVYAFILLFSFVFYSDLKTVLCSRGSKKNITEAKDTHICLNISFAVAEPNSDKRQFFCSSLLFFLVFIAELFNRERKTFVRFILTKQKHAKRQSKTKCVSIFCSLCWCGYVVVLLFGGSKKIRIVYEMVSLMYL